MCQETEHAQTIADGYNDYTLRGERLAVIQLLGGSTRCEASAMDPDHNRQAFVCALRRRPDIEKKTVLRWRRQISDCWIRLHARAAIFVRGAHALPFRRRLRSPPP